MDSILNLYFIFIFNAQKNDVTVMFLWRVWLIPVLLEDEKSPKPAVLPNAFTRASRLMPFSGICSLYLAGRRRASNSVNALVLRRVRLL